MVSNASEDYHEALPGEHHVDVAEIVLPGTSNDEALARAGGVGDEVGLGGRHSQQF